MKKQLLTLGVALLLTATAWAVPAKRITKTIVQSDGTTLTVTAAGDEHLHFYLTDDQRPVVLTEDGSCYYARIEDARLTASSHLAHSAAQRTVDEAAFVQSLQVDGSAISALRTTRKALRHAEIPVHRAGVVGQKKGLVILVNFSDKSMSISAPNSTYTDMFNKVGYSGNSMTGSVHDYFLDQSNGQFDLTFDVVGPVTVSKTMAYYGGNDLYGDDKYPEVMVSEACQLADASVNFADYDWDGDGEVDQVYVVYAGYGENAGASASTIWPHEWQLEASSNVSVLTLDGVRINTYACSCELSGTSGKSIDGIGTACHEFSHCLGLPDFYDTSGNDVFGFSAWSIMDYGCYNGTNSGTPCNYTSYERWVSGWQTPITLSEGCNISNMASLSDHGDTYIIYNEANRNEYYLLENRQLTGWDAEGYGHGMLVLHVDYNATSWANNAVNTSASHRRCSIVPADNSWSDSNLSSLAGDPFPGTGYKTALTNTTTPKASLFNANSNGAKLLNKPIEEIAESNGKISFTFNGGVQLEVPVLASVESNAVDAYTLSWSAVPDAESYTLRVVPKSLTVSEATCVLEEDMSALTASADASTDLASSLDSYMSMAGWTGTKIYKGMYGAKVGSSKVVGLLTTPVLDLSAGDGVATVILKLTRYGLDNPDVVLHLVSEDGTTLETQAVTATGELQAISFTKATDACRIRIAPTKRVYVGSVSIYDGSAVAGSEAPARAQAEQLITDITGTSYTLTALPSGYKYICSVRAVSEIGLSAYSNEQTITIESSTAIEAVHAGSNVSDVIEVYDLKGVLVARGDASAMGTLPAGVYLKRQGADVRKVIVR